MADLTAYQTRVLRWLHAFAIAGCIALVVATLQFGQVILMPVALAIIMSFMLQPLVRALERLGLWRVPSVLVVVLAVGAVSAVIAWQVVLQLQGLAHELHVNRRYVANLQDKARDLRVLGSDGMWTDFQAVIDRFTREVQGQSPAEVANEEKTSVVIRAAEQSPLESLSDSLGPILAPLGSAALVAVLLIFMLIDREDLRNRMIGLFGKGQLAVTTYAIDDAGHRIGRYLLMQFMINASYGLAMMLMLWLIGVPFAILWGLLAAVLRYIPYVGPWLGAALPLTTSLVAFSDWQQPIIVLCFIVTLELFSNMVMEPWLYGHSVGISPVALIVSASFWTLLWGPVGLVLATPLTVCLVVLGQRVPQLRPFAVLLSDAPALSPPAHYYQRLLAHDRDEALKLVRSSLENNSQLSQVFDTIVLPAMLRVRRDRHREELSPEDASYITATTREIISEVSQLPRKEAVKPAATTPTAKAANDRPIPPEASGSSIRTPVQSAPANINADASAAETQPSAIARIPVIAYPAHHESEELVGDMLRCSLQGTIVDVNVVSRRVLCSDLSQRITTENVQAVFIAVMPPGGLTQAAYLCRQLRKAHPRLLIVVGCWGRKSKFDEILVKLRQRGADIVTTSIGQTQTQLLALGQKRRQKPTAGK